MENNKVKAQLQVLKIIFLVNLVAGVFFLIYSAYVHQFKLNTDFQEITKNQNYFAFLSIVILIAALTTKFVIQPMLKLIKETKEPHLSTKITKVQGPYIIYETVWQFVIFVACIIIYVTGDVFPILAIFIGWAMMYLALPTYDNLVRFGKLNPEEQRQLKADTE